VRNDRHNGLVATITLTNRSPKLITNAYVVIDTKAVNPHGGNRFFELAAQIAPGETRTIEGGVADRVRYDFKDIVEARRGYELERTVFADGSAWELPSPS